MYVHWQTVCTELSSWCWVRGGEWGLIVYQSNLRPNKGKREEKGEAGGEEGEKGEGGEEGEEGEAGEAGEAPGSVVPCTDPIPVASSGRHPWHVRADPLRPEALRPGRFLAALAPVVRQLDRHLDPWSIMAIFCVMSSLTVSREL